MKNIKKAISILIILGLLSAITGCKPENNADNPVQFKRIKIAKATVGDIAIFTELAGNIRAKEEAGVVPIYPGIVNSIEAMPGDMVKKGDVLFVIESKNLNNQYRVAKANVVEAIENYTDIKKQYERNIELFHAGAISKAEMDSLTAKIKIAEAQVERSQAAADILRHQLEGTNVKAPISGTVALKNINIGDYASDSAVAMQIADLSSLQAEYGISEGMVGKLKQVQEVSLVVPAIVSKLKGKVAFISPVMDMQTHLYKVKINLVELDPQVRPGMTVKMRLTIKEKKGVIVLPNRAILSDKGINYVYVIINGKVKKNPVVTGIADENRTEVIKGLREGQFVAVEGLNFLSDGERIQVVK